MRNLQQAAVSDRYDITLELDRSKSLHKLSVRTVSYARKARPPFEQKPDPRIGKPSDIISWTLGMEGFETKIWDVFVGEHFKQVG